MPNERNLINELEEVARRLTVKHKCECVRNQNEKQEEVLEFELSHGRYRIIADKLKDRLFIYCEELHSNRGYEFVAVTMTANGVCFKIGVW